jgi:alpha-1,2-mannosyltransferase
VELPSPLVDRRRPGLGRISSVSALEGRAGWVLTAALAIYLAASTVGRALPIGGLSYWAVWLTLLVVASAAAAAAVRRLQPARPIVRPAEATAILALTAAIATDLTQFYQPLRDLGIYLKAGGHFLDGAPVYIQSALTARPEDLTNYPFLYPPVSLPFFAVLAVLPQPLVQAAWVAGSMAIGLAALRLMGLRGRWLGLAVLWPPFFEGIWVGNIAVAALALFAIGPWIGAGLVVGGVFKSYTGLASLWLLRERRIKALVGGVAVIAAACALALPLTGVDLWLDWIRALQLYQTSQRNVPALYGFGLPGYVPVWMFLGLAAAAIAAGLAVRGRDGLARLGTATIVASPSLWGHGMLVAVPSILSLRSQWLWLAIGFTSAPDGIGWWWAVVVIAASWLLPPMRRDLEAEASRRWPERLHPLGENRGPWPALDSRR